MPSHKPTQTNVIELLSAHRSVRSFTDEPISNDTVEMIVRAGTCASTSSNMQAYAIINLTDKTIKNQIAALCSDQPQIHQSAAFFVFCADLHKLVIATQMHEGDTSATGQAEALLIAVTDVALVLQNVAIAAESLGYGICMIGAMRNHPKEVGEALTLPKHVFALSGLCIGRPTESAITEDTKPRLPLPATLHQNRYRSDEELKQLIADYDETQAKWYADHNMHPRDPRWSSVMSRRFPAVSKRVGVGEFLTDQGFLQQID